MRIKYCICFLEGYAYDLAENVARIMGFEYIIKLVPDGNYGRYNTKLKKWDGMVSELVNHVSGIRIIN